MIQTWEKIILDFRQPVACLVPAAIGVGIPVLLYRVIKRKTIRPSVILMLLYGSVLLQTTFFSREPGTRIGIDLELFGTWGQTYTEHAYFIENIMMFIPFGVLAPTIWNRMQSRRWCVFAGFLCSCAIEISQLLTSRGYGQLDDVVTNTAGALAGWMLWKVCLQSACFRNCCICNRDDRNRRPGA